MCSSKQKSLSTEHQRVERVERVRHPKPRKKEYRNETFETMIIHNLSDLSYEFVILQISLACLVSCFSSIEPSVQHANHDIPRIPILLDTRSISVFHRIAARSSYL